jgi:hypothetical protein
MAHVVNIGSRNFPLEIGTGPGKKPIRHLMKPGDVVEVEDAYARRRLPAEDRDPVPSIVEQASNGEIVPAGDPRAKAHYDTWKRANGVVDEPSAPPAPARAAAQSQPQPRGR